MKSISGILIMLLAIIVSEEWLSLLAIMVELLMAMYWVATKALEELEAKKNVDYDF